MTYICDDCGHIFEDGEERINIEEHGEKWSCCPECGGDYEVAARCDRCYGVAYPEFLHSGLCLDCVKDLINFDTFWLYIKDNNLVPEFMFKNFWHSSVPEVVSKELEDALAVEYVRRSTQDRILRKTEFMDVCEDFVMEDIEHFVDWYNDAKRKGEVENG